MKKSLLSIAVLLLGTLSFAHEYLLLAYHYQVQKGDTLEMHLLVADGFNIELERPMQTALTKKFELISAQGTVDLLAITPEGTLPIVNTPVDFEGLGLLHLERHYQRISLPTEKFRAYLKEDHLDNITVNPAKPLQRERYTRYLKALVQSGSQQGAPLYNQVLGQTFEIILLQDPYRLKPGNVLKVQVFFEGKPLSGKIITARNRVGSEPALALTSRTDAKGICSFVLSRKGVWFIHATHMIPCPDPQDSDWESFWASYSFGMP